MGIPDVQLPGSFTPEQAADLAEIQQRIYFYGWCIDHRRFDDLDDLFLPDSIIHYDTVGGTRGPWSEIRSWLVRLNMFRATQHNMHNPIVVFDETGDRATSTTYGYLVHFQEAKDGTKSLFRQSAIYRDRWERCEGRWRILERTLSNVGEDGGVLDVADAIVYDVPKPF